MTRQAFNGRTTTERLRWFLVVTWIVALAFGFGAGFVLAPYSEVDAQTSDSTDFTDVHITDDLTVADDVTITGDLAVTGTATITGTLSQTGDVTLTGDLTVSGGDVTIGAAAQAATIDSPQTTGVFTFSTSVGSGGTAVAFDFDADAADLEAGDTALRVQDSAATLAEIFGDGDLTLLKDATFTGGDVILGAAGTQGTIDALATGSPFAFTSSTGTGAVGFSFSTNDADMAAGDTIMQIGDSASGTLVTIAGDGDISGAKDISVAGDVLSTDTGDIGWTIQSAANQACTTTCTSAAVFGWDQGGAIIVGPGDATADDCICAGAS